MNFLCKHKKTGEIKKMAKTTNLSKEPLMCQGLHEHFDPVKQYESNFRKLKALEFITVMREGKETIL